MSELEELQQKLQDTTAAIARLERMMAEDPRHASASANMRSLQKRHRNLETEFRAAADQIGVDVCSYRLFVDGSQPTLPDFVNALGDFQSLFSIVYEALREGPKPTAHLRDETIKDSTFTFAYSFTGSVGVVLTLPNERLLFEDIATDLDRTMDSIFRMAKAETPDNVRLFARQLGPAPIRALYKWAHDHVQADCGAAIEWRRRDQARGTVFVQRPELERLQNAIEVTSDRESTEVEVEGELVGADVESHTFHLKVGDADIRGKFADAIGPEHAVVLPRPYRATVRVTKRIYYATEREETENFLLSLAPVPAKQA